ncbi:DMT family transporter [Alcaligenaceae bacterium A4P071]|nr:DMT family transporter [Alcaligenaceae bacterium A4P071]
MAAPFSISTLMPLGLAMLAGAAVPLQAGSNAGLGRALGHPLWATVISLAVSLLVVLPLIVALRVPMPALGRVVQGPWWLWVGGIAGVIYVTAALVLMPRLGATTFIVCVVIGQVVCAMLIDHVGLMGLPVKAITPLRVMGALLVVAGMLVLQGASAAPPAQLSTPTASGGRRG